MDFRTPVDIPKPGFHIEPCEAILFVGSCFADSIGQRFLENKFCATINPYGTMYNPASILHTVERWINQQYGQGREGLSFPRIVFLTLGTNHVYRLKATGEIVDNCMKRPASLFQEEQLSIDECADYLLRTVQALSARRSDVVVVFTVSPIRYRKYGYHESQLSKATLLLAINKVLATSTDGNLHYFPAYEILMDELRDYRFYAADMLHPSDVAVEFIWQQLTDHYFSPRAQTFLQEWAPVKAALAHRPFNPDADSYRQFLSETQDKANAILNRYGYHEPRQ